MYTHIDPKDRDAVVWLQLALSRLLPFPRMVRIGELDPLTEKALRIYQREHSLPITGKTDEATLQMIQQQLEQLDGKI
jgi:hypothetical protein